jgi:arginyl-tRNA synthetase
LFGLLGLLNERLKGRCTHLSYGMVELPDGKMKSREGNVVDADDLMNLMAEEAAAELRERFPELDEAELARRAEVIGLAAIKYFILDFNPKTTVHFDPKKSLEFTGRTGPYALYTYARIQSIGRETGGWQDMDEAQLREAAASLTSDIELALVRQLRAWPHTVHVATRDLDPSKITEHIFHLCKAFNLLYNDANHRIKPMSDGPRRRGLLALVRATALAIAAGLELLGIERLESM